MGQHERNGKTAIFLLHLPDNEDWKIFQNTVTNLDDEVLDMAVERFDNKCDLKPVPELATDEWLSRCDFPLGMSDEGEFFDLDFDAREFFEEELKKPEAAEFAYAVLSNYKFCKHQIEMSQKGARKKEAKTNRKTTKKVWES